MRQETDSRHEHHNVDATHPVILKHLPDLVNEDARLRLGGLPGFTLTFSSTEENFALRKGRSYHNSEARNTRSSPKKGTPSGVWDKGKVDGGGDNRSDRISLL